MAGKPRQSPREERHGIVLALALQQLGVGEPGVVVDRHVQVFPAGAFAAPARARLAGAVTGDAVTDATLDAPELLRVEVDQLARLLPFVADRQPQGLKGLQAGQAPPAQNKPHRRARLSEAPGNGRT